MISIFNTKLKNDSFLMALILFSGVSLADSLYIKSEKAKILTEPSFKGSVLLEVVRGTELELLSANKSWNEVKYNNQTGWVSSLLVSTAPPIDKVTHIGADDTAVSGEVRRRASAVATAGATRGLVASQEQEGMSSDYQELALMEAIMLTDVEIDEFANGLK